MSIENGQWIMRGVGESDPRCIHTPEELAAYVDRVGFLPLFANAIAGFSAEERTVPHHWWSDDPAVDPWLWRQILAAGGQVAYGKFFDKKAGFISLRWLPVFANARRDGYDFDALWDDGKAGHRSKKIMDLFADGAQLYSNEVRSLAGFGPGGEKNFEGTVTALQMQTYLVVRDFRRRLNKQGLAYGWPIAVYTTPESVWGYDAVTAAYGEPPETSHQRIHEQLRLSFPDATERQIRKVLG